MYALGYNITKKICKGLGQQEEEGKKFAKFDDVVKLVNEGLGTKEFQGGINDYLELCKLYDKNENGTMMLAELENLISNLGKQGHAKSELVFERRFFFFMNVADEVPKEDTEALLKELADPEDEDGFFPYKPFLERLVAKE